MLGEINLLIVSPLSLLLFLVEKHFLRTEERHGKVPVLGNKKKVNK